ncbi:MAG: phage tail tube protein [Nitrospiraceae bacterium]|nr:phage tail tube protein [Nitrospiraceae bacterium]
MGATGTESRAAFRRAASWGTPSAAGANDGLLVLPHTLKKERPVLPDDSLGICFQTDAADGGIKVEGDIPAYLRYDSLDLLLALAMGQTAGTPVQQGAAEAYLQSLKLKENTDGLFGTFCVSNGVNIDEYGSVKITGFTIKGEAGKPVEISFHSVANDRTTNSALNTTASFAAVSLFEKANRVLFSQGVFRLNPQADAALADPDKIYPSAFELSFKRKMKGIYGAGAQADRVDEPSNDGQPDIRLKLTFPRYTQAAKGYFEDWDTQRNKKMDAVFTGAQIAAPYNRFMRLQLPNLKFSQVELPMERGILKSPVEFVCLGCDTAPAGMAGITMPFQIDLMNRQGTDVLG